MSRRWLHKFKIKQDCWVFVPDEETIQRGNDIKCKIESHWQAPYYYAHLNAGGHVAAIKSHLSSTLFIRADIHQFFNQINRSRVTRNLKNIFGSYKVARQIANESVVRLPNIKDKKFILPFGFVQSAIIASVCLRNSALGGYLEQLLKEGFIVSVYMDDIIISTCQSMKEAEIARSRLIEIANKSELPLNPHKTMGPAEEITVFNIKLMHGNMEIADDRLADFKKSIFESENKYQINGVLGYVTTVSPNQADYLKSLF